MSLGYKQGSLCVDIGNPICMSPVFFPFPAIDTKYEAGARACTHTPTHPLRPFGRTAFLLRTRTPTTHHGVSTKKRRGHPLSRKRQEKGHLAIFLPTPSAQKGQQKSPGHFFPGPLIRGGYTGMGFRHRTKSPGPKDAATQFEMGKSKSRAGGTAGAAVHKDAVQGDSGRGAAVRCVLCGPNRLSD
jgi:hypothetical protein